MRLNELQPTPGSRPEGKRKGRGMSSGNGKTAGRGHKGQKSRSGGYHKVGFEGGQQPIQRRLPKVGFRSRVSQFSAEVRLSELDSVDLRKVDDHVVDLQALKDQGIVDRRAIKAKVFDSGKLDKSIKLVGVLATKGARAAIEKAGGSVE